MNDVYSFEISLIGGPDTTGEEVREMAKSLYQALVESTVESIEARPVDAGTGMAVSHLQVQVAGDELGEALLVTDHWLLTQQDPELRVRLLKDGAEIDLPRGLTPGKVEELVGRLYGRLPRSSE